MKTRLLLVVLMGFGWLAPDGAEAQAPPTTCEAAVDMDISPGFWRDGTTGTFTTNGETGTVTCDGPVNGKDPTGPGTFGASGRYGTKDPDTCTNAEGVFQNSITVPTSGGKERWTDKGDWTAGTFRGNGAFGGELAGEQGDGTFEVVPKEGDCVSSPLTKIHVTVRWAMKQ